MFPLERKEMFGVPGTAHKTEGAVQSQEPCWRERLRVRAMDSVSFGFALYLWASLKFN